ncbi:MAG: hypothetical protein PHH13_04315 [Candidatus Peribacteraceae bacterium]|nr:hypothetical protein [Candidatus Peribacteraceae bacterium]
MRARFTLISLFVLVVLAVAGIVGLGILSQHNLLAQSSDFKDEEWSAWSCASFKPPPAEHMSWVNLSCQRSKTYWERRDELDCTVSGHTTKWCTTNTGKCYNWGWSTDSEDCTIWIPEKEPKKIPCAPGPAQCCMTADGYYSGLISLCTNEGSKVEPTCQPCEPVRGPCVEDKDPRNPARCSAAYANGPTDAPLFAAQRHYDIAAAQYEKAQEAVSEAKEARADAKDAYSDAKEERSDAKQALSAAKSEFRSAESADKEDAIVDQLTAQSEYEDAKQAMQDAKNDYAATKTLYTDVKSELAGAKRLLRSMAAALKAAKKAAQQ